MTGHSSGSQQPATARLTGERAVVLSFGSNLGDRMANLQLGIDVLGSGGLCCTAISGVFETAPVGGPEQANYLNAVLLAVTALPASDVLRMCAAAEAAAGRVRAVHWGPRTLDVDIITYGDEVSDSPELLLPHPRAHERAFVLAPWLEVDPGAVLPGWGTVAQLLATIGTAGVRRRAELSLMRPSRAGRKAGVPCT
jgi:2-amino-4-hydroxy-6-hydroxymethyldihydropteridine diphosphokinase